MEKIKISYFDCILIIVLLPFLMLYWFGLVIYFVQGMMNSLREEMVNRANTNRSESEKENKINS
jgi:hypothetical protein